jgi:DNA-binding SARP family transcriptional activator
MAPERVTMIAARTERRIAPGRTAMLLELQGGFRLSHDLAMCELPLSAQRLLAFLALQDRPLRRLHVSGALWPGSSEARAAASLRTVVWKLRTLDPSPLRASGSHLGLAEGVAVDAAEMVDASRRALAGENDQHEIVDRLVEARDLLPDWYDDWVLIERELLREQRLRALERLCDSLTSAERFADAARTGLAAVACEPLRESPQRALIRLHLAEGNVSDAVRRYRSYCALLERKLGLAPSPRMQELLSGLGRGQAAPVTPAMTSGQTRSYGPAGAPKRASQSATTCTISSAPRAVTVS